MPNLSQSVKGKMIFCRLDPLWSRGCPNPRVESNDVKLIFIFVLFNKYYCVLSKNFVTYSTATQIYISTTCKTAMTTSGKISKNIQFQNTHAGFTIFSVHSQHLKSSSSAFRLALSNLWLLLVIIIIHHDVGESLFTPLPHGLADQTTTLFRDVTHDTFTQILVSKIEP